jgi:cytidylate kinase
VTARPAAPIVAIDGPSGVGKSTAARELARRLGVPYLDTGAMYRTLALAVLRAGLDPTDPAQTEAVIATATAAPVTLASGGGSFEVLLDGEPVGDAIRSQAVGEAASRVSAHPAVRERMVDLQRQAAREQGGVLEGRDIGTVVFPDTPYKFYVDARPEVRHRRRYEQLRQRGEDVTLEGVAAEMERRDYRDAHREAAPLTLDGRYRHIDTSEQEVEAVVDVMIASISDMPSDSMN